MRIPLAVLEDIIDGSGAADSVMVRLDDGTATAIMPALPTHPACSPALCARP